MRFKFATRWNQLVLGVLAMACVSVSLQAQTASQQFRAFSQQTQHLSGSFQQESQTSSGVQKSAGKFAFVRPGKFRWEVLQPFPQLITSDGKQVRQFDPDLSQMTIRPLSSSIGTSPAHILFGKGALDDSFTLQDLSKTDNSLQWLKATPKTEDPGFKYMEIGLSEGQIRQVHIIDTFDQQSTIRFSDLNMDTVPKASVFTITPPAGTDVVELAQ